MRPHDEAGQVAWLHELRNAINTASVSTHVVRRLLESGQLESAMKFLADTEAACERCRVLVDGATDFTPQSG